MAAESNLIILFNNINKHKNIKKISIKIAIIRILDYAKLLKAV